MAQTFSNLATGQPSGLGALGGLSISPASSALNNKINPTPLAKPLSFNFPTSVPTSQSSLTQSSTPSSISTPNAFGGTSGVSTGSGLLSSIPQTSTTNGGTNSIPNPYAGLSSDALLAKAQGLLAPNTTQTGSVGATTSPNPPTAGPYTQPSSSGLYGTIVGSQANTGQQAINEGNTNYENADKNLNNIAVNGTPQVDATNAALLNFKNQNAKTQADIAGDRDYNSGTAAGRGAIIANRYASELPGYIQNVQNALTGQGQQITAGSNLLSGGLTSENQGIGALNNAQGGAAPINEYGAAVSPVTGLPISPAGALSGIATQGGVIAGQQNVGSTYAQNSATLGKVTPMAANLDSLINANGINPSDLTYANGAINWAKANAGSPAQQQAITEFNGQLNDIVGSLSSVLGAYGGNPTDMKLALSQSIINGLQNGQSIQNTMQYFIEQAGQANQAYLSGGEGANASNGTISGQGTVSANGMNFVKNAQGQWVPAQ